MSLKKKFRKRIGRAGKALRFCMSCTSWDEYDVDDFRFDSPEEEELQDTLQSSDVIEISYVSHHTVLHGRTRLPLNDFEEDLWQDDFAVEVPILPGVTCPVLNVCLGFQDHENYPEDPIIDGLPATVWMERFEPTLRTMLSLSRLQHRRCNITLPRRYAEFPDSTHSRHGDFGFGPPAGNRSDNARVHFQLGRIEEVEESIRDLRPHCNARPRNRRRRLAGNPSANPDPDIPESANSETSERPRVERRNRRRRLAGNQSINPDPEILQLSTSVPSTLERPSPNPDPEIPQPSTPEPSTLERPSPNPESPASEPSVSEPLLAEHYLRTESQQYLPAESVPVTEQEHVPFRRNVTRNIRRGLRRLHHWYRILAFFVQREVIGQL
ncbi:uncharacterized protein LOC121377498 [Gigantopelta aegis]|uniref:uncharacterized protein LOC121377498 n=1 Tax=Gigantopelta aegis TaxID=1735272 RepID=UPI001B889C0B|nr:uncharacterized protein LOC121377498 [Gigantopelta aegis]